MTNQTDDYKRRIKWSWHDHPLGFPIDPDDDDFEGPRTPAFVVLNMTCFDGETTYTQAVTGEGLLNTISENKKELMKSVLRDWLGKRLVEAIEKNQTDKGQTALPCNGENGMNRSEHLQWCKDRALEYVDSGDLDQAFSSMLSDIGKHSETDSALSRQFAMMMRLDGKLSTPDQMREFINGFN